MARINYLELPAKNVDASRAFYHRVFGFEFTGFGPTYASTMTGDVDMGLQGDPAEATKAPLGVIGVEDLEAALAAVLAAGGTIARPIFAFPGGRRFHFMDVAGNELAAVKYET